MPLLSKKIRNICTIPVKVYHSIKFAYQQYERFESQCHPQDQFAYYGEGAVIQENVSISWPDRLYIGKKSIIQRNSIIHSMGGVHIGDYAGIGHGSILVSFSHNYLRPDYLPYDNKVQLKPIIIKDYVWCGFGVRIMPGVEVGEGAILGLGAVVTKNVPPLAIVIGNPAEVVGYRNKEKFEACKLEQKNAGLRTLSFFGKYEESIPNYIQKKYKKELIDLGLL
ncbi:MAG: acyltransferase [Thermodesulfobacteriota bacterium]|nr:acyltransferase [Thermodesulfobacteriota bacterium]